MQELCARWVGLPAAEARFVRRRLREGHRQVSTGPAMEHAMSGSGWIGTRWLWVATITLSSCAHSTSPEVACPYDVVRVRVAVLSTQPQFTWAPACPVSVVAVNSPTGAPMWAVEADSNVILPPVQVGQTPPNGTIWPNSQMVLGNEGTFTVSVYRSYALGERLAGDTTFTTPPPAAERVRR